MSVSAYSVVGLMSGTSLDGLDVVCCRFTPSGEGWDYALEAAETLPYSEEWTARLRGLPQADGLALASAHADYGHLLGCSVADFIRRHAVSPCLVASHGHTVFHQPEKGFTLQIGDGAAVAAECGLPVVSDFRVSDVALGGQGAPLVPLGDEWLFSDYDACLNIGGISNISFRCQGRRVAFDIVPSNQVFNRLASSERGTFRLGRPHCLPGACGCRAVGAAERLALLCGGFSQVLGAGVGGICFASLVGRGFAFCCG